MDEIYDIDYVIKVFTNHVERSEKERKDHPEHYLPQNGDKFPEFNLCKALLTFAKELKSINKSLDAHIEDYHKDD